MFKLVRHSMCSFFFLLITSTLAFAQPATLKIDVAGVTWKSSMEDVEKAFGKKLETEKTGRFTRHRFQIFLKKVPVNIDVVESGQIDFMVVQLMPVNNDPSAIFDVWLTELTHKYGKPSKSKRDKRAPIYWSANDGKRVWLTRYANTTTMQLYIRDRASMHDYYRLKNVREDDENN